MSKELWEEAEGEQASENMIKKNQCLLMKWILERKTDKCPAETHWTKSESENYQGL